MRSVLLLLLLAGCSSVPSLTGSNAKDFSAEQIKELVKDKNAGVVCARIPTPWGIATTTVVNLDQNVVRNGGITISPDCTTNIETVSSVSHAIPAPAAPQPAATGAK